jgi:rubrerythrin
MKTPIDVGRNRTGIATSPQDARKLAEAVSRVPVDPGRAATSLFGERFAYSNESPPVGTVPPPASLKGVAKTLANALQGEKLSVLLDLIGERLAYERTGVRLYEALLAKLQAADPRPGRPTVESITFLRDQELEHFQLLWRSAEQLGGDPTAMTPAADITAMVGNGIVAVLSDARITLNQALRTMLSVELTDVASWGVLIDLAQAMDQDELVARFQEAADHEEQHLIQVREWVRRGLAGDAGVEKEMEEQAAAPPPP